MFLKGFLFSHNGVFSAIAAITMTFTVTLLAGAMTTGNIIVERSHTQNSADLAALSASGHYLMMRSNHQNKNVSKNEANTILKKVFHFNKSGQITGNETHLKHSLTNDKNIKIDFSDNVTVSLNQTANSQKKIVYNVSSSTDFLYNDKEIALEANAILNASHSQAALDNVLKGVEIFGRSNSSPYLKLTSANVDTNFKTSCFGENYIGYVLKKSRKCSKYFYGNKYLNTMKVDLKNVNFSVKNATFIFADVHYRNDSPSMDLNIKNKKDGTITKISASPYKQVQRIGNYRVTTQPLSKDFKTVPHNYHIDINNPGILSVSIKAMGPAEIESVDFTPLYKRSFVLSQIILNEERSAPVRIIK